GGRRPRGAHRRRRARASGIVRATRIGPGMLQAPHPRSTGGDLATGREGHFFAYVYRLRLIQRWVLMRSAIPESVGEHSFQVALLTHGLCTIARDVFGKQNVDAGAAVVLALFHDAEEVVTGDIPAPVKH